MFIDKNKLQDIADLESLLELKGLNHSGVTVSKSSGRTFTKYVGKGTNILLDKKSGDWVFCIGRVPVSHDTGIGSLISFLQEGLKD